MRSLPFVAPSILAAAASKWRVDSPALRPCLPGLARVAHRDRRDAVAGDPCRHAAGSVRDGPARPNDHAYGVAERSRSGGRRRWWREPHDGSAAASGAAGERHDHGSSVEAARTRRIEAGHARAGTGAAIDDSRRHLAAATESLPGAIEAPPGPPTLSQGPGRDGGAGTGTGPGDGPGRGPGLGPGRDGGTDGGGFRPGNGVTQPIEIRKGTPQYTADAIRARIQGSIIVECVV